MHTPPKAQSRLEDRIARRTTTITAMAAICAGMIAIGSGFSPSAAAFAQDDNADNGMGMGNSMFSGLEEQLAAQQQIKPPTMTEHDPANEVDLGDGVRIVELKRGRGNVVADDAMLGVRYSGWVASNGNLFDTTEPLPNRGARGIVYTPFTDRLIDGWIIGLEGMREGGKRKIMIPAELGFGSAGNGTVPPNADLIYEIELVEVTPRPEIDPQRATKTEEGGMWKRLKAGSGQTYQEGGFLAAHVVLWDEQGDFMGTSKSRNQPMTVQWEAPIFWGPYARGMQAGERRAVSIPNPRAGSPNGDGSANDAEDNRWSIVIDAYQVFPPIKTPKFDRDKAKDLGDGLLAIDLEVGDGEALPEGAIPIIKFTGWVVGEEEGEMRMFDTTEQPGRDELFASPGLVIKGLERGLEGMKIGDRRLLYIPAELGHGDAGFVQQRIPPNADLVYEVEVIRYEMPLFLMPAGEGDGDGGGGGGGFNLFGGEDGN